MFVIAYKVDIVDEETVTHEGKVNLSSRSVEFFKG